jgi:hypothetical protein
MWMQPSKKIEKNYTHDMYVDVVGAEIKTYKLIYINRLLKNRREKNSLYAGTVLVVVVVVGVTTLHHILIFHEFKTN